MEEAPGNLAEYWSQATNGGGGGVPVMPGTMAGATHHTAGSSMCALDAMGTTRGRDATVGSQPRRMAADMQVMAAQETSRCEVVSPGCRGCFNSHCCIALCLSCVFERFLWAQANE